MPHKTPEALGRNGFKVGTLRFIMCPEVPHVPHVPRWRFFQVFFFSCFFLSGPLDQVEQPPGGERNRTPCGGYGEAAGAGVSGPNCPKKETAYFPKFPEQQKDLASHH